MQSLQQLMNRRTALLSDARKISDNEKIGRASDDDFARAESYVVEAKSLKAEIDRRTANSTDAVGGFINPADITYGDGRFGSGSRTGTAAERLFGKKTANDGFDSFGSFLQTLDSGRFDNRMRASNTIGVDSEGGFLVPAVYQNMFLDAVIEDTILAQRVVKFPMTSDTLNLNGWAGNDHSSSLFGGIEANWEAEIPTLSVQTPTTRRVSFHAHKLMVLTRSSNELITDAPMYEEMLGAALIKAAAWKLDYALFQGDGAGKALGCINAGSTVEVAKESSQTAATIWYDNVVKMFARLHPSCYKNGIWCFNPKCIPELFSLDVHESATATGSTLVGDYTYRPFRESDGKFSLFGLPAFPTEKLPTLGQVGDIVLVDPTQYGLGMRQEVVVEKSSHAGFESDSSYYRAKLRCDGTPLWSDAMTPRAGDSLSWCVTLAIRE